MSRATWVCVSAVCWLTLCGCGKPNPADAYQRPEQVRDFARLYGQHCAGCHGAQGNLGPAPPLNDPLFLAIVSDGVLRDIIHNGRAGTLMPSFGGAVAGPAPLKPGHPQFLKGALTDEQVDILVKGIREHWAAERANGDEKFPSYAIGDTLKEASAEGGAKVFKRACARCHGEDGLGGKEGAVNNRAFLALVSDQMLRRIVITGRPDLGMPDFRGQHSDDRPLTEQEIADVVALLVSWRVSGTARANK
jgi:mono/diheme cytochrome c family protein